MSLTLEVRDTDQVLVSAEQFEGAEARVALRVHLDAFAAGVVSAERVEQIWRSWDANAVEGRPAFPPVPGTYTADFGTAGSLVFEVREG